VTGTTGDGKGNVTGTTGAGIGSVTVAIPKRAVPVVRYGVVDGWALWATMTYWVFLRYAAIGVSWLCFVAIYNATRTDEDSLWPVWLCLFPLIQTVVVPAVHVWRNRVPGVLAEQHFLRRRSLYLFALPECGRSSRPWSYLEADMLAQQHGDLSLVIAGLNLLVQAFTLIPVARHYRDDQDLGPTMTQMCVLSFVTCMTLSSSTRARVCCIRGASSVRDFLSKDAGDEDHLMFLFEVAATAAAADTTIPTQKALHEWASRVYPGWTEQRRFPPPYDIADTILAGNAAARNYMWWLCIDSEHRYRATPRPTNPARQL
jgi:hypothetical protein